MSMLDALRYHGAVGPRWVSPTGRLMFAAPENAAAVPVKPHTFHGGADPAERTSIQKWWLDPHATSRDDAAMRELFPDFVQTRGNEAHPPMWTGVIDSGFGRFPIMVLQRKDHGLPRVMPLGVTDRSRHEGRRTVKSPHLFASGHLCVAEERDWEPDSDTIATVVSWAAHWHACFVSWRLNGVWPAAGASAAA